MISSQDGMQFQYATAGGWRPAWDRSVLCSSQQSWGQVQGYADKSKRAVCLLAGCDWHVRWGREAQPGLILQTAACGLALNLFGERCCRLSHFSGCTVLAAGQLNFSARGSSRCSRRSGGNLLWCL